MKSQNSNPCFWLKGRCPWLWMIQQETNGLRGSIWRRLDEQSRVSHWASLAVGLMNSLIDSYLRCFLFPISHLGTAFVQPREKKQSSALSGHADITRRDEQKGAIQKLAPTLIPSILPANVCCFLISIRGVCDVPKLEPVQLQQKAKFPREVTIPSPGLAQSWNHHYIPKTTHSWKPRTLASNCLGFSPAV